MLGWAVGFEPVIEYGLVLICPVLMVLDGQLSNGLKELIVR